MRTNTHADRQAAKTRTLVRKAQRQAKYTPTVVATTK